MIKTNRIAKWLLFGSLLSHQALAQPTVRATEHDDLWFAPCKNGASTCNFSDRDWTPYDGYTLVGTSPDRSRIYISAPPYRETKGYKSAWILEDFKLATYRRGERVSLYQFDCQARAFRIIQQSQDGLRSTDGGTEWIYASPKSMHQSLVDRVCSQLPVRAR